MKEETVVRENLMNDRNYRPYCGAEHCTHGMPRTKYNQELGQFRCPCGWVSVYPKEFIERYKEKWGLGKKEAQ